MSKKILCIFALSLICTEQRLWGPTQPQQTFKNAPRSVKISQTIGRPTGARTPFLVNPPAQPLTTQQRLRKITDAKAKAKSTSDTPTIPTPAKNSVRFATTDPQGQVVIKPSDQIKTGIDPKAEVKQTSPNDSLVDNVLMVQRDMAKKQRLEDELKTKRAKLEDFYASDLSPEQQAKFNDLALLYSSAKVPATATEAEKKIAFEAEKTFNQSYGQLPESDKPLFKEYLQLQQETSAKDKRILELENHINTAKTALPKQADENWVKQALQNLDAQPQPDEMPLLRIDRIKNGDAQAMASLKKDFADTKSQIAALQKQMADTVANFNQTRNNLKEELQKQSGSRAPESKAQFDATLDEFEERYANTSTNANYPNWSDKKQLLWQTYIKGRKEAASLQKQHASLTKKHNVAQQDLAALTEELNLIPDSAMSPAEKASLQAPAAQTQP